MSVTNAALASARTLYQGQPTAPIVNATTVPTMSPSGSGGGLAAGTYYVAYTWLNTTFPAGYQETILSTIGNITITIGQTITVTIPTLIANSNLANIYIGTVTGRANMHLQGTTATTTFVQTVALNTVSAVAPVANQTFYGNPLYSAPALSANVTTPSATAYITEIIISNTTAVAATLYLNIIPFGSVMDTTNAIMSAVSIAANTSTFFSGIKTYMSATAFLNASQSKSGSLNLFISGVEVQ